MPEDAALDVATTRCIPLYDVDMKAAGAFTDAAIERKLRKFLEGFVAYAKTRLR